MQNIPQETRLHALDAVRAIALLSGVALHAALSYAPGVGSQLWPLRDSQTGLAMSITIFLIHIFRMPVFFLIAGFFAHMLFYRQGALLFLRNRMGRILLPLAFGWIACLLIMAGVVLWHLWRMNGGQIPQSVPPEFANAGFTFMHLWFLYIPCGLYPGVLLLRWAVYAIDREKVLLKLGDRIIRWTCRSPLQSLALAVPITIAFLLQVDWAWWFGIPTPGYTVIPPAGPLFTYGYVFGLGWLLNRQRNLLENLGARCYQRLLIGLGAAIACRAIVGPAVSIATVDDAQIKLTYAALYAIAMVSLSLALIGLGVRFLAKASPVVRYVSDASYWMYIAHLPVVMAMQTLLMPFELHWGIKFATVNLATCALLLLAYRHCVRSSWIGMMLNGRKYSEVVIRGPAC